MKGKKVSISVFMAMLILAAGIIIVAAGPELVTNGDFAAGLSGWGTYGDGEGEGGGPIIVDDGSGDCGADVLDVSTVGFQAGVDQCIPITEDSGPVNWTLSADMRMIAGLSAGAAAHFYDSNDCTGASPSKIIDLAVFGTNPTLQPFSNTDTYGAPAGSSVRVLTQLAVSTSASGQACYDNISLSATDPTAVTLGSFGAFGQPSSPWVFALLIVAAAILAASVIVLSKRFSGLNE